MLPRMPRFSLLEACLPAWRFEQHQFLHAHPSVATHCTVHPISLVYSDVPKKVTVLLNTSLAWLAWADCSGLDFSRSL